MQKSISRELPIPIIYSYFDRNDTMLKKYFVKTHSTAGILLRLSFFGILVHLIGLPLKPDGTNQQLFARHGMNFIQEYFESADF